jgi:ATP-binding cassette subfamily A (ABC1) protein 3
MFYQFTLWSIVILIFAFPNTDLLSGPDARGCTIGLLILFGPAMSGFVYLLSFLFKSAAGAQVAMIFIGIVLGLVLSIIGIVLRLIGSTTSVYVSTIRYVLMVLPPFALGDSLHAMTLINTFSFSELGAGAVYKPIDMKIAGAGLVFLGFESVLYLIMAMLIEYGSTVPSLQSIFSTMKIPPINTTGLKDDDVLAEEERVKSGAATDSSVILVDDFKKVYPGGKYAVKGVSLGIPNGECFGLLGINGAGKSTTLAMLSGEFPPTTGTATLGGLNLLTDVFKVRRRIGFCPQFDALFDLLTGREHLTLYAHIKGIASADVEGVVNGKISEMGLVEYADRSAGTYSGGNKRKLSVAIAMIGEPTLVFLDEPSTGMDPVARRHMWEIIIDIVTKREKCSLILTTHSMEECEALCTRVGIMVGGVLRCLGSSQRLKSKYGLGYQIELSLNIPTSGEIDEKSRSIVASLNGSCADVTKTTTSLTRAQVTQSLRVLNREAWISRIAEDQAGSELAASLTSNSEVGLRDFVSFCILEESYDRLTAFLTTNFDTFVLRERQQAKVRIEVSAKGSGGEHRKLSTMFGAIEEQKSYIGIQEYSIGQTSLEQIFNQFASQVLSITTLLMPSILTLVTARRRARICRWYLSWSHHPLTAYPCSSRSNLSKY